MRERPFYITGTEAFRLYTVKSRLDSNEVFLRTRIGVIFSYGSPVPLSRQAVMVEEFHKVRKHWPIDLFWKRKRRDIQELEQTAASREHAPEAFREGEYILHHVERVLGALDKLNRTRKWLFVKLVLAWLVAYSLTLGEIPWFLVKIWEVVNTALNGAPA